MPQQQPKLSVIRSRSPEASSFKHPASQSSLAQAAIEQDLEDVRHNSQDLDVDAEIDVGQEEDDVRLPINSRRDVSDHSMVGSYRHPSCIGGFNGPPLSASTSFPEREYYTEQEQAEALAQERSLLRDNQLIPPKHPRIRRDSSRSSTKTSEAAGSDPAVIKRTKSKTQSESEGPATTDMSYPNETSALLGRDKGQPYGGCDEETLAHKWEEAVADDKIQTTWQRETKVLTRFSWPLFLTFVLQWSFTQASVLTVGHIGKKELGAVCLGSMTASITGYAVYQGLATSLDTLCAQAYGSGYKTLVGLQMQRMVWFLWIITIPIAIIWASGAQILGALIPDKEVAAMAGLYLKILIAGAPGYAAFESGKRFVQAQGLFRANMYCLLFCAPLNALLHYLFVWVSHYLPFLVKLTPLRNFLYLQRVKRLTQSPTDCILFV